MEKRKETTDDMPPGPKRDFWVIVERLQREHPELTLLEAQSLARLDARGKALWAQVNGDSELLAPLRERDIDRRLGKRGDDGRVPIRKRDQNAETVRSLNESAIADIQKRFVREGMSEADAWAATARDPEANRLHAQLRGADASLTVLEFIGKVKADLAAAKTGKPATLHAAVTEVMKRDQIDYATALDRVVADPQHTALVAEYQQAR
jgi:hypothetical protein